MTTPNGDVTAASKVKMPVKATEHIIENTGHKPDLTSPFPEPTAGPTYKSMDDFKRLINVPFYLFDGKTEHECVLRNTRRFDPNQIRWKDIDLWCYNNTGGNSINFRPLGWRPVK
jgi:hypothetical protein